MAKKPSLGRQKIKIAKIQIKNHLQVTFSKRRSGLFKKASELCTLCGVEIAIVVFSPAGKVFSFGHPKVESVVDRFLLARNSNLINSTSLHLVEAHRIASIPELNMQLTLMVNELEAEKKRTEALDEMRKTSRSQFWWEAPIEDMSLHELEQLKDSMEELKKIVAIQANQLFTENSNSLSIFGTNNNSIRGGVDHYEMKPTPIIPSSSGASHVQNYGYGHGLFGSFVH